MTLTQKDVDNIHELEAYLKKDARTVGEMATHLNVTRLQALDYLEIMSKNPKRYRLATGDLGGQEKKWLIE